MVNENDVIGSNRLPTVIIVLTFYYTVTVIMSVMVNLEWLFLISTFACLLIYMFNTCILMTWIFAVIGVVKDSFWHAKQALILWTVLIGTWILIVLYSFSEYGKNILCLEFRCPESFWVHTSSWHENGIPVIVFRPSQPGDFIMDAVKDKGTRGWEIPGFGLKYMPLRSTGDVGVVEARGVKQKLKDHKNKNKSKQMTDDEIKNLSVLISTKRIIILLTTIAINAGMVLYSWLILFGYYNIMKSNQIVPEVIKTNKESCC